MDALLVDPWGIPYILDLDENEGEFASNPYRKDTLTTYGPDQSRGGGDDVEVEIPFGGTCL